MKLQISDLDVLLSLIAEGYSELARIYTIRMVRRIR